MTVKFERWSDRTKRRCGACCGIGRSSAVALLSVLIAAMISASLWAQDAGSDPTEIEFFESKVRPLLIRHCVECHSTAKASENGGLNLETVEGIAAGGSRGPVVGSPDEIHGLLLQAIEYTDVDLQMPPSGKMPAEDIAILKRWISAGGALPAYIQAPRSADSEIDYDEARRFWSFQPLRPQAVPDVTAEVSGWDSPIDRFLLQAMQARGLRPNPPADRATVLRRLTFDLTGLPPTPEQLQEFLADSSPVALENAVDRLLASPQYGERWARFWLDLARYTEFTPEWQSPTDRGWIYRDWVVHALNSNLPYDQFVKLQLAADLMANAHPEDQAALGFLGLSPTYWKELRLAPVVIQQIVADEWDERIDAVSRTFLGLTTTCARCHDHKFDPISMEDYYGLAGVFASSQLDERPLLPMPRAQEVKDAKKQLSELEAQLKTLQEQKSPDVVTVEQKIRALKDRTPELSKPFAHVLREASLYVLPDGDELTRLDYREGESRDVPVFRRGNPGNPGPTVARRFLKVLSSGEPSKLDQGSGRRQLAEALLKDAEGLVARVFVNRIWDQHFGSGLVRTTSDFGVQGERPTHPELLEYLAYEFVAHGWDIKWLHRQMVLAGAYAQSSESNAHGHQTDPDNRLLWRANRRRLDLEMWRDAFLMAAGNLDLTSGGPAQSIDSPDYVRRSLYLIVAREELHPVLRMHDFPEASSHSPRREPTITPLQQLYFLNSPWVEKQAEVLYRRIAGEDAQHRIQLAYQLLFARDPDLEEVAAALEYLRGDDGSLPDPETDADSARWRDYLQALMALNEAHYLN